MKKTEFEILLDECKIEKPKLEKSFDKHTEHQIQSAFFALCYQHRNKYPVLNRLIFAIPNGGNLVKNTNKKGQNFSWEGKKLKDEGMKSGVLDVFLSVPNTKYHGLYLEFKSKNGVISDNQMLFCNEVRAQGYLAEFFNNEIEAFNFVVKYLEE